MKHRAWNSTAKSHPGSVRPENEDAFLNEPGKALWCVADGMGGHDKGDVASQLIVDKLSMLVSSSVSLSIESITQCVEDANSEILSLSQRLGGKVGSTVVILWIYEHTAHVLWAGDSRVYRFSNNKLSRVTADHNQAEELLFHGLISPEKARTHPGTRLITRAVGISSSFTLEHTSFEWKPSDRFILCSDGLNGALEDHVIESLLSKYESLEVCESLLNCALDSWARDNVTVIAIHPR